MMAFLFGSTNLAPAVAALAWIFLGWQFALALVVGSIAHVAVMAMIVRMTYPEKMLERARKEAAKAGEKRAGMHGDPAEGLPRRWREKLSSGEAWHRIGMVYRSEWGMVWKDLFFGFLIAGAVATLVPDAVFQAIFPRELTPLLLVPIHALLGPVLAIFTIIGSMGNGPLAAVLWENGVLFAGISHSCTPTSLSSHPCGSTRSTMAGASPPISAGSSPPRLSARASSCMPYSGL